MLDARRLRILRELAARGTVAATAEALSYTPSAVSQQLSVLEREAGVALLERDGRRLRLTDAGRLLVAHADAVLGALEAAAADLEASSRTVSGTLRVTAFQTAARAILPEAAATLMAAHPAVEVHVSDAEPQDALPALRLGELDVVVGHEYPFAPPLPDAGLHRVELFRDPLHLALGPARRHLEPRFAALTAEPWIAGHPGTSCYDVVVHGCRAAGFAPRVVAASNDFTVVLELVRRDLGIAMVPGLAAELAPPDVTLVDFEPSLRRRVDALVREGAQRRPAVAAFLDELRRVSATRADAPGRHRAAQALV